MNIRRHVVRRIVRSVARAKLFLPVLSLLAGCSRSGSPAPNTADANALPDPLVASKGGESASLRLLGYVQYYAQDKPRPYYLAYCPWSRAQLAVVRAMLSTGTPLQHQRPVVTYCGLAKTEMGTWFVDLHVVNANRETQDVVLWFEAKTTPYKVICRRDVKQKDDSYVSRDILTLDLKSAEQLETMARPSDGQVRVIKVQLPPEIRPDVVPFPKDPNAEVFLAVRDRNGQMSGFVPVHREPSARASRAHLDAPSSLPTTNRIPRRAIRRNQ